MSRPDWHYGDVLAHPLMSELRVMFIAWSDSATDLTPSVAGLVLSDDRGFSHRWEPGEVHADLTWTGTFSAKLIERLER